jgi:hypothetical protein
VDPTEGRLAALKSTVSVNLHLTVATWNPEDRGKTGIKKMKRTPKMPYALRATYSLLRTTSRQ